MAENFHKFLKNVPKQNDGFKKKRGWAPKEEEPEEVPPKLIQDFQKDRLRRANALVYSQRKLRREEKTIEIPATIDFIKIHFFSEFNLDLQKKFLQRYGLSVVEYSNFNKSVLLEVVDESLFMAFSEHVQLAYDSSDTDSYEGKPYNLIALIFNFEFLTDKDRIGKVTESGFLISLVSSTLAVSRTQRELMLRFLGERTEVHFDEEYPEIIEVKDLSIDDLSLVAKNFDIVRLITSSRSVRLRPGAYGELRRDFGFEVDIDEKIPVIGIIDTGVSNIDPLRPLLTNANYDHTGRGVNWDEVGHGTMVAGIVAFGDAFNTEVKPRYAAKAKLAVLKVIHNESDDINVPRLLDDIRDARRRHGIKLFNMSLNLPLVKIYNSPISKFAYELDRLAHEEDLLIFLSVGNYEREDLEQLTTVLNHPAHQYPNFFYELNSPSDHHSCWFTNIQEPAESMNNLSIGALAGNVEGNMNHDATPASEYPAYYSRKFHYDFYQTVNGTNFKRSQNNKFLNKPDLVFEGGDVFQYSAGIEILRSPLADGEKYFGRQCGTSLATPFVTSLAGEIQTVYPAIRAQTIKALLINSAVSPAGSNPPAFHNFPDLYKKLTGFGKVKRDKLVFTDENSAVFVIEDEIDLDEVIVVPIYLPETIADNGSKLHVQATLCYSFLPVRDNHLNYLPLYISYGFFKNVAADVIATAQAPEYKIKSALTWAEDFHGVENRLFSNTQKQSFNLQTYDLEELKNELCVAIRCTNKNQIPAIILDSLKNNSHHFSLVISFTEIPEANATGELNSEINRINTVANISEIEGLAEADLNV